MRAVGAAALGVMCLMTSACWFSKKKPQTPVQVPRATQRPQPPKAAPAKAPTQRRQATSAPRAAQPAAHPPKAAEPNLPGPKPAESQRLGRILSPDEAVQYKTAYDRSWSAAQELLRSIAMAQLPPEKKDLVARIRSFLAQAQESAATDLAAAAQLAYRAEVLARDLTRSLH